MNFASRLVQSGGQTEECCKLVHIDGSSLKLCEKSENICLYLENYCYFFFHTWPELVADSGG